MEKIFYNKEDKEVSIITGYGIGSHLCLRYLTEIVNQIRKGFPLLTDEQCGELVFLETDRASRSHRYMFYTRFSYDMSDYPEDEWSNKLIEPFKGTRGYQVYQIGSHKQGEDGWNYRDESAAQCVSRLVHAI